MVRICSWNEVITLYEFIYVLVILIIFEKITNGSFQSSYKLKIVDDDG